MYRKFLFLSALLITTSVFAFGGGGPGRIRVHYRRGVDAVGVHRDSSGDQGDFCMYDLSGDPNAEEISTGVFQCKGGSILNCDTGVCTPCAAGTYAAAGEESCSTTPAGHYTPEGASAPIPCPEGTYQPEAGQSACIDTEPGYEPTPDADDKVPCSDTTTKGACNCPANQYADGAGHCVPDSCEGVWINECTPSCTQSAGPTHLDDGTGCQDNLGTCQNGVCCAGDGNCATEQEPELYCVYSDANGECAEWNRCGEGLSTKNLVVNVPSALGVCVDPGNEIFCQNTLASGKCEAWAGCGAGNSTQDWIVETPNARGTCKEDDQELYCLTTNSQKKCTEWQYCAEGQSTQDWIIGTASATGHCCPTGLEPQHDGTCSGWCKTADSNGACTEYAVCASGNYKDATATAAGICADNADDHVYCYRTNVDGVCKQYKICANGNDVGDPDGIPLYMEDSSSEGWGDCCTNGTLKRCSQMGCKKDTSCTYTSGNCIAYSCYDPATERVFCEVTDPTGKCWYENVNDVSFIIEDINNIPDKTANIGQFSENDWINPTCAESQGYHRYCHQMDTGGECISYGCCAGNYKDATETAQGVCGDTDDEFYCKTVDGEGNCTEYASCPENATCDGFAIVCNSGYTLFEDECITNDCPGDHQWKRSSEDYCKDCSTPPEAQSATTVEDCIGKCVGYRYVGKNKSGDPKCWSCGAPGYSISIGTEHEKTESSCNACLNRYYSDGHCVCDSDHAYDNNSKCCPPGQHPNAAKTGCCNDGEACDEDVTDCTGKNDGVVCSATDSSLLDNPSHQLPVCINQNCECPYEFWQLNAGEGVCTELPTGSGAAHCNKLTEKEVACNVAADGQFISRICVAKDSSFNGVGLPECSTTSNTDICTYECVGSQDVNGTTCCAEFSCGCVSATNNYVYYTDKERTLPYCDDQQTSVSVPAYQNGTWTTTCVNLTLVQNTCQTVYGGACMANVDAGYIGYCEDALVQNHGASCIDPAAIQPVGELPQT